MASLSANALFNVSNMVFVVTGGGSGLGETMALALDENGASRVFILGRRLKSLEKVATKAINRTIEPIVCDVSSKEALSAAAIVISNKTSFVNAVIASSGATGPVYYPTNDTTSAPISGIQQRLWGVSLEETQSALNLNVLGSYHTFLAFLNLLDAGNIHPDSRGRKDFIQSQFITISSLSGYTRTENVSYAYMASKAALIHLTKSLATDFGSKGIRANSIAPGLYVTEMTESFAKGKDLTVPGSLSKDFIPMTRSGSTEDIAGTILFLTSRAGAFLNGNVILSDGGTAGNGPATY